VQPVRLVPRGEETWEEMVARAMQLAAMYGEAVGIAHMAAWHARRKARIAAKQAREAQEGDGETSPPARVSAKSERADRKAGTRPGPSTRGSAACDSVKRSEERGSTPRHEMPETGGS